LLSEAIKTSAIERAMLDQKSLSSFLVSLISNDEIPDALDRNAVDVASLRVGVE